MVRFLGLLKLKEREELWCCDIFFNFVMRNRKPRGPNDPTFVSSRLGQRFPRKSEPLRKENLVIIFEFRNRNMSTNMNNRTLFTYPLLLA